MIKKDRIKFTLFLYKIKTVHNNTKILIKIIEYKLFCKKYKKMLQN